MIIQCSGTPAYTPKLVEEALRLLCRIASIVVVDHEFLLGTLRGPAGIERDSGARAELCAPQWQRRGPWWQMFE